MRTLVCGFAIGALLLAAPWPWRPWIVVQAVGALATILAIVLVVSRLIAARRRGACGSCLRRDACAAATLHEGLLVGLLGVVLGLGVSGFAHERGLADRVGTGISRDAVPLVVRIVSDPVPVNGAAPDQLALRFQAEILDGYLAQPGKRRILRLSWYGAQPLRRGEVWRVAATVRPPWGYVNPGGFDYERWLFGQGMHGTGSIRRGVRLAEAMPGSIDRYRERLGAFLSAQRLDHGAVLGALLVGFSGAISEGQWEIFRITGTIHLMVISGLHIGLAASLGFGIGRWVVRLCPPALLWIDARKAGAGFGVICAMGYLALSGGGLPAVRACLMAAPALLLVAWGRRCQSGSTLLVALAGILAVEPLAVHQQGFWLSFGAVALLVMRFGSRYGAETAVTTMAKAQVVLTVCMAPLLILLMGAVPLVGAPANLIAVPVVSLAVVPLTLAGGLLAGVWPAAAGACFALADWILGPLFVFLAWCSRLPLLHAEPPAYAAFAALLAGLVWLFDAPARQKILLVVCLAVALLPGTTGVPPGEFRVIGLDVGQGDAILVDTARHRLLFDAGPAFPGGFETGSAVVVPSALATGGSHLDVLVLSHEDIDHVGGAGAVEQALSVGTTFASFARPGATDCESAAWTWDGVEFGFLDVPRSGPAGAPVGSNDGSCILLIDNGRRRVLLAGDIGASVEAGLLRRLAGPVDLLFAPHHGSLSSSSRAFVRMARPRWVFVSAGRDNRYGHPHPRVVERYRETGAVVLQTAEFGALAWESSLPGIIRSSRLEWAPYWRGSAGTPAGK